MSATKTTTKTKTVALTPEQEALQRATDAYSSGSADYSKQLLASGSIRDAIARAVAESDPTLDQLRASKADISKRLGTVYADSIDELSGVTDPRMREQIRARRSTEYGTEAERIGGLVSDRAGSQAQQVDKFGNIFNAQTAAKQFDVGQKQTALERAITAQNQRVSRQQQLEDEARQNAFAGRMDDLTRREKEASIAATNRSNRGGGGAGNTVTFQEAVANPLLAFLSKGGQRVQDQGGGFQFFGPDGKPITVDDAMKLAPGSTRGDFLSGSKNAADAAYSGEKPPTQTAKSANNNAQSGLRSLDRIESLYNDTKNRRSTLNLSRLPFGLGKGSAQQYNSARKEITDIIARLRTGAVINEQEEKLYKTYVPGPSDSEVNARWKMDQLRQFLTGLSLSGGATSSPSLQDVVDTGV